MEKNKCTLIIDGNWLLMSRMWAVRDKFLTTNDESENRAAVEELKSMLARSISITLGRIKLIDNILIVTEGGSWRKGLEKPTSLGDVVYKGNRTKDTEVNWDLIWGTADEFYSHCTELGITVSRVSGMEGDDLAYYWSRRLNNDGINCIIWSTDRDLTQLVQYKNCVFTAWFNSDKGVILPEIAEDTAIKDPLEFFMTGPECDTAVLKDLKKQCVCHYINPDLVVMEKIVCGDTGDNIYSIIRQHRGGKVYRVSEKVWDGVRTDMGISTLREFFADRDRICEELCDIKKVTNVDGVKDEFDYNKKLVWLSDAVIPDELIKKVNETDYFIYDVNLIRNNYKILSGDPDTEDVMKVFEGTLPF